MDVINELILNAVTSPWLYVVMFATAVIDGFFPPIPSETVLVAAAAVAVSTGGSNLLLLCAVAAVGAAIGDNIAYLIGRGVGTTRFAWMRRPRIAAAFDRAGRTLGRRGAPLILGARYIPVGRVVVNMSAGALRYPWRRFLPLSVIGGVTWAAYSAIIGVVAGKLFEDQPFLSSVLGVGVALVLGLVVDRVAAVRRRRRERSDAAGDGTPAASGTEEHPPALALMG
ncbi:membrane protein DedA, SNARE-associated domain [Plantibacter flavus]|uniref:Membrane protein DedA with SNARE-associated domain n=1 Tax=Plantibacter flavus TaxID=150123 RepID=A0A3N2C785_9MICO|nr:VTT domain-containing protein [Plantibacter flavus]ROR83381.1 membrane protein DedA with SNARE-associated domain [Plantibacter flavus]SMG22988.1 membrane protein DedA, SNARE-associated domain [Plantibacter flavus]